MLGPLVNERTVGSKDAERGRVGDIKPEDGNLELVHLRIGYLDRGAQVRVAWVSLKGLDHCE